jgi:hypothetical protein
MVTLNEFEMRLHNCFYWYCYFLRSVKFVRVYQLFVDDLDV